MDARAGDARRSNVADATIVELHVDEERRFAATSRLTRQRASLIRRGWIATLLVALGFTIGWARLDSARRGVATGEIERGVRSDLSSQLLGDVRVESVSCVRETDSHARCLAKLFDKSGIGPYSQGVTVSVEQDTGEYSWQPAASD